jgi:peroxiredoxin/YHS domain-containing protein
MPRPMMMMMMAAVMLTGSIGLAVHAGTAKGTCVVCQVMRGEAEPEPIKAVRTYEGTEYGLCSARCAKEFDADPAAFVPPVLPRPAPAFALQDFAGNAVSNPSLKGTVVLLDFWATWCAPCRKAMPELQALHDRYRERGFRVIGISIDEGGRDKVAAFVSGRKITYPIALDAPSDPAWGAFRVKAVPASYLIDRGGRIVAQWTGAPPKAAELKRHIESLLEAE